MTPEQLREAWDRFNATVRNKVAGEYGPFTNQHWADICAIWQAHADALEELARLRARLEIDFATDGNGKRVPFPTGGLDGIACRDETIRILESALAEAERKCARLRFHAEAMAKDLELSYEVGESSLAAYQAEFKEE